MNPTLIEQAIATGTGTDVHDWLPIEKSAAFAPPRVSEVTVSGAAP